MAHEGKFTILGILSVCALGDFVIAIMACVYAKKKISNSALLIYAHDDRPYKNDILKLCPHIDDKVMGTGPGMPIAGSMSRAPIRTPRLRNLSKLDFPTQT